MIKNQYHQIPLDLRFTIFEEMNHLLPCSVARYAPPFSAEKIAMLDVVKVKAVSCETHTLRLNGTGCIYLHNQVVLRGKNRDSYHRHHLCNDNVDWKCQGQVEKWI